jgi:hypothetical protein
MKKMIQLPPANMVPEKEAAHYIGMSVPFLRKSRMEGRRKNRTPGPPYSRLGRSIRYSLRDLDAWLLEHRVAI